MEKAAARREAETARPDNIRGILWALLGTGLFAVVAALAKVAVVEYHVLQILFFRQIVVFLSALPAIAGSFPESLRTRHPGKHAIRLGGAFIALSTSIWAVAVLPLATAVTLGFVQVFFVALLSARFLGEPVGSLRLAVIVTGFVGVVIVMQPGAGRFADPYALIPVLGAFGAALAVISVRQLSQTESTATLLVYQSVFVGLLAAIPLPWLWKTPDLAGLLLLTSMGVVASAGQWAGVKALRLGEASVVGNIQYTQLIYAAVLGYALFGEIPEAPTLIGGAIIVGSALLLFHREQQLRKAERG